MNRAEAGAPEPLTVLVLAGGQSSRLGQDKAWLMIDGQSLIQRVVSRLRPLASEIIICANDTSSYRDLVSAAPMPTRTVPDHYPGAGPLAGLHAGLLEASYPTVLAVATDMPFVNPGLFRLMLAIPGDFDAIVPHIPVEGSSELELEPLHALYRRSCLPAISRRLENGHRRLVSFLADVRVRYLEPEEIRVLDPRFRSFYNINTLADWERARQDLLAE